VLEVAAQHAALDQHGPLRGRALVVDVQRAAPRGDRAVVDDGAELRRDARPDAVRERGRALAVEVALEPVAHRLVQEDARPAGAGRASRFVPAWRAASRANASARFASSPNAKRPPPPCVPCWRLLPRSAMHVTERWTSGRTSPTVRPSGVATRITRCSMPIC